MLIKTCTGCGKLSCSPPFGQHRWMDIKCNKCLGLPPGIPSSPLDPKYTRRSPSLVPKRTNQSAFFKLQQSLRCVA